MKFNLDVFKAYDIRGESEKGLVPELALAVGQALADYLPDGPVVVGHDMRLDSIELAKSLINGLLKQGRDVINLGEVSTDMVYFRIQHYKSAGGAMVTASHDPKGYNGIKLTGADGSPIGLGSGLEAIRTMVEKNVFATSQALGREDKVNILEEWVDFAIQAGGEIERPLKIAWDAGNGMGGIVVDKLRNKTSLEITGLFLDPDGDFPNHQPNPMIESNLTVLKSTVKEGNFDCGVAFDGDADRAMLVDENGETVGASQLGLIFAGELLKAQSGAIVYNVACSRAVPEIVAEMGGKAIISKVGRPSIKEAMKHNSALLGIEEAQHYYFPEFNNDTSGLIACLRALSILSKSNKSLSELVKPYKKYVSSPEITIKVADPISTMAAVKNYFNAEKVDQLDGLSVYTDDWWFNVRPSNTESLLRLNIEAKNQTDLDSNLSKITDLIKRNS